MKQLIPLVTASSPPWPWVAANALSGIVFLASVAALGATLAERDVPRLSVLRGMCVLGAGLLVGLALLGWLSQWGSALSCLGALVSLEGVALAFGRLPSLESYAGCRTAGAEPAWWTEFERGFRRHAAGGGGEQNPLCRAVTRPARRMTDAPPRPPTARRHGAPDSWQS
jgi:hypothetical protein